MRIISRRTLREHWAKHPDAEEPLRAWFAEARKASWSSQADIKTKYGSASILKKGRVVFNIGGNKHRLVVQINFAYQVIYVRFVGTHEEYDEIDAETI